jgi:hypothetical protein
VAKVPQGRGGVTVSHDEPLHPYSQRRQQLARPVDCCAGGDAVPLAIVVQVLRVGAPLPGGRLFDGGGGGGCRCGHEQLFLQHFFCRNSFPLSSSFVFAAALEIFALLLATALGGTFPPVDAALFLPLPMLFLRVMGVCGGEAEGGGGETERKTEIKREREGDERERKREKEGLVKQKKMVAGPPGRFFKKMLPNRNSPKLTQKYFVFFFSGLRPGV